MNTRKITGILILITAIIWIVWDIYAYVFGGGNATISVVLTDFSFYSPALPFIMGGLMGHWFFPAKRSID